MPKKGAAKQDSVEMRRFRRKQTILSVIFVAVVIYLVVVFFPSFAPSLTKKSKVTVAKVNGDPIFLEELKLQYDMLPQAQQQVVTYGLLLNRTIEERLLLEEAKRQGISVSQDEVINSIDSLSRGMSREDLDQRLARYNMTYDDLRELQYRELMIGKLINRTVLSDISISQERVRKRYERRFSNRTGYKLRHITVETEKDAGQVGRAMELGVPYHALVMEFPQEVDDMRSEGDIGYVSPADPRYPGLTNLTINQTKIYERDSGYEVVQVTDITQDPAYETVAKDIRQDLIRQERSERLIDLLDGLKDQATIRIFRDRLP